MLFKHYRYFTDKKVLCPAPAAPTCRNCGKCASAAQEINDVIMDLDRNLNGIIKSERLK